MPEIALHTAKALVSLEGEWSPSDSIDVTSLSGCASHDRETFSNDDAGPKNWQNNDYTDDSWQSTQENELSWVWSKEDDVSIWSTSQT